MQKPKYKAILVTVVYPVHLLGRFIAVIVICRQIHMGLIRLNLQLSCCAD